jgi:hypothetical protein
VTVPLPAGAGSAQLAGVSSTGPADVWAVGRVRVPGADRTLTLHFDGRAWAVVPSADLPPGQPGGFPADHLVAVTALAPDDVWAVGARVDPDGLTDDDLTLIEHWDGTRWTITPSPSPFVQPHLKGVAGQRGGEVFAVGDGFDPSSPSRPDGRTGQIVLRWDGSRWAAQPTTPISDTQDLLDAAAAAPGIVWAVGRDFPDGTIALVHRS